MEKIKVAIHIDQIFRDTVASFIRFAQEDAIPLQVASEEMVSLDFRNDYVFENDLKYEEFMEDFNIDIFGHADIVQSDQKAMSIANALQEALVLSHEFTLISTEKGKARAATLFFLSKCISNVDHIRFINDVEELGDYQALISADERLLNSFKGLKLKKSQPFNEAVAADVTFNNLVEIFSPLKLM